MIQVAEAKESKIRLLRTFWNCVLFVLISSCISPYSIKPTKYTESIIVQGMVSDQPGPYEVIISRSVPLQYQIEDVGALPGSTVIIEDDQGNREQLREKTTGHFYTSSLQGTVGVTYTLTVTTSDGSTYKSTPEKLQPVGDLSLYGQFLMVEPGITNNQITSNNGFNVYLDSQILPEQEGRVWWRWTGTYHVQTSPNERVRLVFPDPTPSDPDPSPFYVQDVPPCASTDHHPVCTCCDCWVSERNLYPLVSDVRFSNNGQSNHNKIAFVEVNRRTMYDKYHLEVQQLSLSQPVFDFWQKVAAQASSGSNLFQTPYPPLGGNMTVVTENATPVIGYFAASSIRIKS